MLSFFGRGLDVGGKREYVASKAFSLRTGAGEIVEGF